MKTKKHLLFLCSGNIDRGPAAESLFENNLNYETKSAGLGPLTENPVIKKMIDWADIIFVMEAEHFELFNKKFPEAKEKRIICLGVPNTYLRYDPELERLLKIKLENWLE